MPSNQPAWIASLVRIAAQMTCEAWALQNPHDPSHAALAEATYGTRASAYISKARRMGVRPSWHVVRAWAQIEPKAGILLLGWLPALMRRVPLRALRQGMRDALERLGIPHAEIQRATQKDTPTYACTYSNAPMRCLYSEVLVQLVLLRRLNEVGPIGLEARQAWFLAGSMVEAAAVHSQLREIMPVLWEVVMRNFVSEREALQHSPILGEDGFTSAEYEGLAESVASVLRRQRLPDHLPCFVSFEFQKVLFSLVSKQPEN